MINRVRGMVAILWAALLLTACGDSDGPRYDKVVSFGDSLSDSGTYNVGTVAALGAAGGGAGRFTVNSPTGSQLWVDHLAAQLGAPAPCAAETGLSPNIPGVVGAPVTAHPGCFSYAQGGARITSPLGPNSAALQAFGQTNLGLLAKPVANQMAAHLAAAGGSYSGRELVTVFAGSNDVFMVLSGLLAGTGGDPVQAVADIAAEGASLAQLVRTQVVGKGALRVLVLTLPDIAKTPFIRSLETLQPGISAQADVMVLAFNAQLVAGLRNLPGVQVGDVYSMNKAQLADPAQFGFTNVTTPACGPNALGSTSLVCNASNTVAADVASYYYADDVHPTPYTHSLLGQLAQATLAGPGLQ